VAALRLRHTALRRRCDAVRSAVEALPADRPVRSYLLRQQQYARALLDRAADALLIANASRAGELLREAGDRLERVGRAL
jgi:hypothetical protein